MGSVYLKRYHGASVSENSARRDLKEAHVLDMLIELFCGEISRALAGRISISLADPALQANCYGQYSVASAGYCELYGTAVFRQF